MLLKYFYDERLAQASYLVGASDTDEAIIIDPARDITPYLQAAQALGLRIAAITETHIHADFVSGTRELAAATGATVYVSGMGGADWAYTFPDDNVIHVKDGDAIQFGSVRLDVVHTPGHTPEHIAFMVTDTAATALPYGIFSGDFLFAGDVGRPDLLEVAAGYQNTADPLARQQFESVQKFKALPDYLLVFPGHGAGSICGKSQGGVPSTTLGYEKLVNPAFQYDDEDEFVAWLLTDQLEAPRYFAQMKRVNREGPTLLRDLPQAQHIAEPPEGIVPENALFIDTRPAAVFARRHIPGTINIPIGSNSFSTYTGWYVDYDAPTFFIAFKTEVLDVLNALLAIGVYDVPGYFTNDVIEKSPAATMEQISAAEAAKSGTAILDVRGETEFRRQHVAGALHIPMGDIPNRLSDIPTDKRIAIVCESGVRSQVVASLLQKAGFTNVVTVDGGMKAWKMAGLPIEGQW